MKARNILKISLASVALTVLIFYAYNARVHGASSLTSAELKSMTQKALDEACQKGNMDALDQIFAPDIVIHGFGGQDIGLSTFKSILEQNRAVYPDCRFVTDRVIIEGNMAVSQSTFQGTYKGPKKMQLTFYDKHGGGTQTVNIWPRVDGIFSERMCTVARIEDGKLAEMWIYRNIIRDLLELSDMSLNIRPVSD